MRFQRTLQAATAIALASALLMQAQAGQQEIKGQLKIGLHKVKLEQGKLYQITLNGPPKGNLQFDLAEGRLIRAFADNPANDKTYFIPKRTDDYAFIVTVGGFGFGSSGFDKDTLDYTLKFTSMEFAEKPLLVAGDKLTAMDPKYKQRATHYKSYKLEMKAGKVYILDLVEDGVRDPYLYLENAKGEAVASDDDSGGGLNARIVYTPRQDGEFTIIATTLGQETGGFVLTVRGTK